MVVLAGILTVLAWPIANLPAKATLDGSWQIALHLAAGLGLRHGVEFVFTYGPLGFLGFPIPYLDLTSTVALTVSIAIYPRSSARCWSRHAGSFRCGRRSW